VDRDTAPNNPVSDPIDFLFSHAPAKAGKMPMLHSRDYALSIALMLQNARQLSPDGIEELPLRLCALA
jgi:hypothetical protein